MLKILSSIVLASTAILTSQFAVAQQFIDISKGGNQICGLTSSNALLCSTSSAASRLEPPTGVSELLQVTVGDSHACGLQLDGRAVCWGDNNFGQLDAPTSTIFQSIDAGVNHTCAITTNLEAVCWGLADNGRLDVPTDGLPFIEIDAGLVNTCALEVAGGIRCWGVEGFTFDPPNAEAQIQAFAALSTNSKPEVCGLLTDGSIECSTASLDFTGFYTDIAATGRAMCALGTSGEIECQTQSTLGTVNSVNTLITSLNALNDGTEYVQLFSGQGLCAIDVVGGIACADAVSIPGAGSPALSNFVSLPSISATAPSAVDDLTASIYSGTTIELLWTSFQKGGDGRIAGAEIYRDGVLLTTTSQSNSYLDTTLELGVDYSYEVRIINTRGDVGTSGNLIMVNTDNRSNNSGANYTRPTRSATPGGLSALIYSDTVAELIWNRAGANVFGYEIYRNHEYLGFISGTSYLDNRLLPNATYHYDILAVSQDGEILGFEGLILDTRGE